MPLIHTRHQVNKAKAGFAFVAEDAETGGLVIVSVEQAVVDYYSQGVRPATDDYGRLVSIESGPAADEPDFRTFMLQVASRLYDDGPKDGYVIIDMAAMELSS